MRSESARMSSAAEARFRVQVPGSTPRATRVVALDHAGESVVRRLAAGGWEHATFLTASSRGEPGDPPDSSPGSVGCALRDLVGHIRSLAAEIDTADLVILVAGPGGHAHAASLIGDACRLRSVMTTGFIVGMTSASASALSKTLAQLRPWSRMVVIASSDDYIDDMMTALRA
jgi:hypothetical protein